MNVLALDPGETTGWAVADFEESRIIAWGEMEMWYRIDELLKKYSPEFIIHETFALYPWMAKSMSWSTFPTVEVIGAVKYCALRDGITVIAQPAADKKQSHFYFNHQSRHVRDAVAHAVVFCRRNKREGPNTKRNGKGLRGLLRKATGSRT